MIWESGPWKEELVRLSKAIKSSVDCFQRNEEAEFELERAFFYAAFIMRKLIDDGKVTDKTSGRSIELDTFASLRSKMDNLSIAATGIYDIGKEFDLDNPCKERFSARKLAGEIIHSFALVWVEDEQDCVIGVFLCSYKNQDKRALFVELKTYCDVVEGIADDWITELKASKDLGTGKVKQIRN